MRDARGQDVTLPQPPRRIVSLVPSITELLADLGLHDEVVGLTRFCVRPEGWKDRKHIVGGTKQVDVEKIARLKPDLILANVEENTQEMVEALDGVSPTFVTNVRDLAEAVAMIHAVGSLTGHEEEARAITGTVVARFDALEAITPLRAAYLIWRRPYMTVGRDTFIHDVMARGGFLNAFGDHHRYPEVTLDEIAARNPDVLLLSSEPFPFRDEHVHEIAAALPEVDICLVDGQMFSWYGSRLLHTPGYLRKLRAEMTTIPRG